MNDSVKFEYRFTVSHDLLDDYGHVNNARYLDLYENARWDILEKSGLGRDFVRIHKIGPVILEVTVQFRRELLPGEEIIITTKSRKKNDLIMYFDQEMINPAGKICSSATFTVSLFDLQKRKVVRADAIWSKAMGF